MSVEIEIVIYGTNEVTIYVPVWPLWQRRAPLQPQRPLNGHNGGKSLVKHTNVEGPPPQCQWRAFIRTSQAKANTLCTKMAMHSTSQVLLEILLYGISRINTRLLKSIFRRLPKALETSHPAQASVESLGTSNFQNIFAGWEERAIVVSGPEDGRDGWAEYEQRFSDLADLSRRK
ncbi:hypothetical protein M406DRAFT_335234 [Cryphonectria parasitica EP155]|uniref:Uncharacterized protein n=1 Tax=Cryphonectria parasitica (strain ATCC 38755 / EP155) TaxID=660469 RepID=A0A9P5CH87_CRYP1|nr:uncharacterized protein M406DRAFT_335234 [Cryphonectria parasitica EP155]KAF3760024.1 hypothetical protein M406DRAFT_335234 [Cryphonectria parasitica EP155]